MEIYFTKVVEDLIVTALLVGMVFAYARDSQGRIGMRVVTVGIVVSVIASLAMAIAKQNTALIATGDWNMGIFITSLIVAIVALICAIIGGIAGGKRKGPRVADNGSASENGFLHTMTLIVLFSFMLFMVLRVFYKLPDVVNYPANFGISADKLVSTDIAFRLAGWLAGIAVIAVTCVAVAKAFKALDHRMMGVATGVVIGIICLIQTVSLCQILIARRIIKAGTDLYKTLFAVTTWASGNALLFTILILAVFAALAVFVIVLSLRDKEPYSNPAEHRKNKARWRNRRRWAICVLVCIALSAMTVTVLKDYTNRGPQLSPSEECEVRDGNVYVSLEQVEDGHLHRFTYTTESGVGLDNGKQTTDGVGVRFIVIKKPGSSAYGVGLDACEICGQTGYYERDGQVVCRKCDVVMNINTIGFKGGCNPIPVEYSVADGYIVLPTSGLAKYEKTFK